jgi:hypothetical protein
MTARSRTLFAGLIALAILGAACGDGEPSPGASEPTPAATTPSAVPTVPVTFTSGEATVTVTGSVDEEFTADVDETDSTYDPSDAEHEILWTNEDGRALRLTITATGTEVQDAFIAIGVPGLSIDDELYFPDAFHTQCTVTLSRASPTELKGEFTCTELDSADGTKQVDANGTFEASAT